MKKLLQIGKAILTVITAFITVTVALPLQSMAATEWVKKEKLPDYYIDFTSNDDSREDNVPVAETLKDSFLYHVLRETDEKGSTFTTDPANLYDPYFNFSPESFPSTLKGINMREYDHIAIRLKPSRTDLDFQIRLDTKSDGDQGLWYWISVKYVENNTDWQTICTKFSDFLGLLEGKDGQPATLDDELINIRFDTFNDVNEAGESNSAEGDNCVIESVAFFKTAEEAAAFTGLYEEREVKDDTTPVPGEETQNPKPTPGESTQGGSQNPGTADGFIFIYIAAALMIIISVGVVLKFRLKE